MLVGLSETGTGRNVTRRDALPTISTDDMRRDRTSLGSAGGSVVGAHGAIQQWIDPERYDFFVLFGAVSTLETKIIIATDFVNKYAR